MKITSHKNNFDFLRLIFALCVIITHSYTLTGAAEYDWLHSLTNGQVVISYLGVRGFFILSGYLIYQSIERTPSIIDFFRNRCLRIFPGLAVVLLLTVILGYFVYSGNFHSYITNKSMWTYFPNNIKLFRLQGTIQGVFERNVYKDDINGSIFTIQYEFICYIIISLLLFVKKFRGIIVTLICLFFFICNIFFFESFTNINFIVFGKNVIDFSTFFFAGAFLAFVKIEKFKYRNALLYLSLFLLIASLYFNLFKIVHLFALPLAVILFGVSSTKYISRLSDSIGDLSYGVYIYAFAVQQSLVYFFGLEEFALTIYASLISLALGYLSWHFIEKPALRYKKGVIKRN